MKISKLFHWLYAILMLLPILVFIPNAFYYGFNEQAVAQEKTEQVPVYYDTNIVNSATDLHIGNIYQWNDNVSTITHIDYSRVINIDTELFKIQFPQYKDINVTSVYFQIAPATIRLVVNENPFIINDLTFVFIPISISSVSEIDEYLISHISSTDYLYIKEYQPLTTTMSITDSMSYAWDSVWQNDLFSWSYGSFLTQPFIYIGNLFNVPVDNSLYYALSYWLDISLIWLTFDLLMYVPLLVHRWLDKGIIE